MLTILKNSKKILIISGQRLYFSIVAFVAIRKAGMLLLVDDPLSSSLDLIVTFAGDKNRSGLFSELMVKYPEAHWLLSDFKDG